MVKMICKYDEHDSLASPVLLTQPQPKASSDNHQAIRGQYLFIKQLTPPQLGIFFVTHPNSTTALRKEIRYYKGLCTLNPTPKPSPMVCIAD